MAFEHYVNAAGKRLRCGYTTGTCAALAAAGAARLLLAGAVPATVALVTPKGLRVEVPLEQARLEGPRAAVAAVAKDAGDDADVTDGLLVWARVELAPEVSGVAIDGGEGVGRVTKPGLDQPVGAAAINRVPRQMIAEAVAAVRDDLAYEGGLRVTVFVPGGETVAQRTFNPDLGIEGGISILGTSGIVEPMSEAALVETVCLELRQAFALHQADACHRLILTPGNYGLDFLRAQGLDQLDVPVVRCSNFVGEALDEAALLGFDEVLLVGHAGKFVKLAGGIMNTHSRMADCRMELVCAHAAACGAPAEVCRAVLDAATVDAALEALLATEAAAGLQRTREMCDDTGALGLDETSKLALSQESPGSSGDAEGFSPGVVPHNTQLLQSAPLVERTLASLMAAAGRHVAKRAGERMRSGVVMFSNVYGCLGQTATAKELLEAWKS